MENKKEMKGIEYLVFLPENPESSKKWPIVLIHGDAVMKKILLDNGLLPLKNCLTVMVLSKNRIRDFSPWPHKALNTKFPDFEGKADKYLEKIERELLPAIKKEYSEVADLNNWGVVGQSLGGLLNLYAYCVHKADFWGYAACISPSSWYPDFLNLVEKSISSDCKREWFFTYGSCEGKNHMDIKKDTVTYTKYILNLLRQANHGVKEIMDNGGHHDFLPERYSKALSWLDNNM